MTLELYLLYTYVLMCCCFEQGSSIEDRVAVQSTQLQNILTSIVVGRQLEEGNCPFL